MCLKFDHDLAKRSLSSLLILALWALAPLEAHAQTAEDTVAHMLYGVRDGAQQFSVSTDFSGGRIQAKKAVLQGVWKREDNGLFVAHIQTGRHSSVLRIVVRRLNYCTFTALVSSRTDDPDYDDENLVTVNFSKVSSIIYRADQRRRGYANFLAPYGSRSMGKMPSAWSGVLISPRPNQRGKRPAIRKDSICFQPSYRSLD
jgi:hypothetical protein